mgnify:CR=1 FL=1
MKTGDYVKVLLIAEGFIEGKFMGTATIKTKAPLTFIRIMPLGGNEYLIPSTAIVWIRAGEGGLRCVEVNI